MANIHNQALLEGIQLGVYEIKEASKIGTFDITYRAWNHHLKEWVEILEYFPHDFAIRANDGLGVEPKSPSHKEDFEYGLKAFLELAEELAQIEHTNIVKTENILQFNGTAYLILAYQEGVPLSKLIQSRSFFAETELKFILLSILDALKKAHKHNTIHGGIQPETIILDKNGIPFLTHFSSARLAAAKHTTKFTDELAPGYSAPELYGRPHTPGPATDYYGLGATMYYCITHNQPTDAQSRLTALSKGESDPVAPLAKPSDSMYSTELLQAIDWMLRPNYNNRPRSANEIITLLNSGPTDNQGGQTTSPHDDIAIPDHNPIVKKPLWIGIMAGIFGLIIFGLWFVNQPSETNGDKAVIATAQPLTQSNPSKAVATPNAIEDQPVALTTTESSQEPKPASKPQPTNKELNQPDKKLQPANETIHVETGTDDKLPQNDMETESKPVSKPQSDNTITPTIKPESGQKVEAIEKSPHSLEKQKSQANPSHEGSINGYLAAAKKAMKEVRFTTPAGNNAYEYYQKVLAKEPGNAEALAGRQRIVDRYAWFIRKSKADGKLDKAKRVLQRAESVLPNDPKLQIIREELSDTKE